MDEKLQKRKLLIEKGLNPYPFEFKKTIHTQDIAKSQLKENQVESLAGRLMRMRSMGQAAFFNLQDEKGQCQCYLKAKELSEKDQLFFQNADIGDIVGVKGCFFKTKKGEPTLRVQSFKILCKSTEPLPEKYHGLENKELRYRHRHLDLIMNEKTRKTLKTRALIIQSIREYMNAKGFMEVETPVLQPIYGGALASPFSTHHESLDAKFYLKISPELYLKRLIAGGFEKVYEIGKNFRNEGMDRLHNPEFTMMEYYEAYTDYEDQMNTFEQLIIHIVKAIKGSEKITYQGKELDFSPPWKRLSIRKGIQQYTGLDITAVDKQTVLKKLQSLNIEVDPQLSFGHFVMTLFEAVVEKEIWNPCFFTDFPKDVSPLTKNHRNLKGFVERFEPFIAGMEIGNAYTELNDPVDQRERLKEQERFKAEESHPMDEDFLHAVGVGMPPVGGVGLGIERLIMLLTDQRSIREVIWFPTVKSP